MKTIRQYIEEAKNKGIVKNDAEVARKIGVTRAAVSRWCAGERTPSPEEARALAEIIQKNPGEVMAEAEAARTDDPATREIWERIANMCATTDAGAKNLTAEGRICIMSNSHRQFSAWFARWFGFATNSAGSCDVI